MSLALIFDKQRDDTVGVYFERACHELGVAVRHFWVREASAIPERHDLYLRIDHGDYREDLPAHLRPNGFYAVDTHLAKSWKRIRRLAAHYDQVYCAQRQAAEAFSHGMWVPLACDLPLHGRIVRPLCWDVAFVGTDGGVPRKFYLQALRERYPKSFLGHAPHTQLGAIYSQAKIGFNYSIRNDLNMRIFEILSAGSLLITNRLSHDDLARLGLREGHEYVGYRGPRELMDAIDYYLHHEAERQAIAQRGMHHVQRHHTYRHRLEQILRHAQPSLLPVSSSGDHVGQEISCGS